MLNMLSAALSRLAQIFKETFFRPTPELPLIEQYDRAREEDMERRLRRYI
jgi:hypothetical protein